VCVYKRHNGYLGASVSADLEVGTSPQNPGGPNLGIYVIENSDPYGFKIIDP